MEKRRVIIVTDGDKVAQKAVETAAKNIGGRCISSSAGNPTPLTGREIVDLIKIAKHDPVILMVDDRGDMNIGEGEQALQELYEDEEVTILGVIAVASNTKHVEGIKVDFCIENTGKIIKQVVDKEGNILNKNNKFLLGDTVDVLRDMNIHPIIGIGDPGKMMGKDNWTMGAPILTRAMEEVINWNKSI